MICRNVTNQICLAELCRKTDLSQKGHFATNPLSDLSRCDFATKCRIFHVASDLPRCEKSQPDKSENDRSEDDNDDNLSLS